MGNSLGRGPGLRRGLGLLPLSAVQEEKPLGLRPRGAVEAGVKSHTDYLGPWEQIFYVEFDGRRRKRVVVKILGE